VYLSLHWQKLRLPYVPTISLSNRYITLYSGCPTAADVVFIIDSSSSLGPRRFYDLVDAVKLLGVHLNSDDIDMAMETYADDAVMVYDFNDDVIGAIQRSSLYLEYIGGTTATDKALKYCYFFTNASIHFLCFPV
jgi:hypothetical protein